MGNELNQERQGGSSLVVGLDAGGTRTRAVLATAADGRPLGEGAAGPGNALTVPVPQLTEHLAEAVGQAVPESVRDRVVAVAGGFAGATDAVADEPGRRNALAALTAALRRLGIDAGPPVISSDIEAAFASAPGAPADGLALVAGTGAVAMRITGRRGTATVDGDGWLLGDDGSGFWIGRAAVRAALRMADGRGAPTVLAELVGRELGVPGEVLPGGASGGAVRRLSPDVVQGGAEGASHEARREAVPPAGGQPAGPARTGAAGTGSPVDRRPLPPHDDTPWSRLHREAYRRHLLPAVMAEPPIRLARLAPLVAEAAGDAVALAILDEAADQLTEAVRALDPRPGERVVTTGGLLGPGGPLTPRLEARLQSLGLPLDWVPDGRRGAVALARLAHQGRT
ncbi:MULTISPECIES: N-acetylglucosamine kinase [Streptomyces]|uniref:N-acetylglucosamine kinase n=1 Tax=Streptomyces TaxID=1883 RepID=UPI00287FA2DC|nr:BadF/BadG/BcrA/BcrD ATPase family protein [Streptomyces sp. CGMCC 4.1456]WNF65767.1 BadF/BadG/BcrA/BcrD ATPase family protein [Streptomyces sp. CGMCC 4.1456]